MLQLILLLYFWLFNSLCRAYTQYIPNVYCVLSNIFLDNCVFIRLRRPNMDEVKCKRDSDKLSDETFLLLSTSLKSISSSPFATHSNVIKAATNQHSDKLPPPSLPQQQPTETTSSTPLISSPSSQSPPLPSQIVSRPSLPLPTTPAIANDQQRNNRIAYGITNTMPLSKSQIVHTCCYKHHCQLSACHINNGEFQASTSKKLLLSVPLQRKRKQVVYSRDFCGAIGIDGNSNSTILDLASDQRLVIAHYSCVEKFTKMYTPSAPPSNDGIVSKNPIDDQTSTLLKQTNKHVISADENATTTEIIAANLSRKCDENLSENLKVQRLNSVSPMSDEGLANASPYCSSGEEEEARTPVHEKVERSSSSDSALGLDEEILAGIGDLAPRNQQRRMTLTVADIPLRPALLPVAEPTTLPDSPLSTQPPADFIPTNIQSPVVVPSKMILEARIVEIPTPTIPVQPNEAKAPSRRESCFSDITAEDMPNVRIVRTPSVVVSDYSDDVLCGITLEELEFFRQQRKSSLGTALDSARATAADPMGYLSDMSAASSCSNLNFCGSSISLLDENYPASGIPTPERKMSGCSMCSTGREDNEEDNDDQQQFPTNLIDALQLQQRKKKPSGWRKLRNIVQWTPFFQTYKKQRYPWVQLAGHQGNFKAGPDQGTVLKKLCPKEELCFHYLMKDVLRPYVPEYKGQVTSDDGELYLQLQDLLSDFDQPCVMDCKIGVRTYLEEELSKAKEKPKLRKDMYEKMIQIDKDAPNDEEHRAKGVTKPRYMVWRETISSTATLGFRIEGIKKGDGTSSKDFKTTKSRDQIKEAFKDFTDGFPNAVPKYIQRLKAIRATLLRSDFFQTHEVIGSSLLFVHDRTQASIWLIDFAKTVSLPDGACITHINEWIVGNHEDGYLIGINNLIQIFEELLVDDTQQIEAICNNENEAEMCSQRNSSDDAISSDDIHTSNQVECTSPTGSEPIAMQVEECQMKLPLEIDAMKIDQATQQMHRDQTEDN